MKYKMKLKERIKVTEKKKKYLVSTMNERDKLITKLKSSLYSLSIDELILQAVNSFQGNIEKMRCSYCKEQTVVSAKQNMIYPITIAGQDYNVEVINYPRNFCKTCENEFKDNQTTRYLSELIDMEIFKMLRYEGEVPSILDFKKIIVISGEE